MFVAIVAVNLNLNEAKAIVLYCVFDCCIEISLGLDFRMPGLTLASSV